MQSELQIELNRRDKKRYLEELSELENKLASCHSRIFWIVLNLLIIEPAITAGAGYYFWDKFKTALSSGQQIANWGEFISAVKWSAIIIAFMFATTSLSLLFYLWRIASLKSEIARIRTKLSRLE